MSVLLISIAVIGATLLWPVNRWIMHNEGRPKVYGFWLSIVAAFVSGCAALIMGQSLCQPIVWAIGGAIGFAFATGYCLVIMHCLRIGPVGPTVAMNNMGMLWPVVLGALWLTPHPLSGLMIIGIILVILSLVSFGLSKRDSTSLIQTAGISTRWILWAFLGWVLAGISMTAQLVGSIYASNSPFAVVFAFTTTSAVILAPSVIRLRNRWFNRKEMLAAIANGVLLPIIGAATLTALNYVGPEVVFPFTAAAPLILMLILGQFLYHEYLDKLGWLACFFGVGGLVFLSLGQA
ncbi:MAG: hypothetical protein DDT32_01392 [Syntrophomonadaceae bacterium]|nr:hypothetical protein [Bacillota bacterium]